MMELDYLDDDCIQSGRPAMRLIVDGYTEGWRMISLLLSSCVLLAWDDPPKSSAGQSSLSSADVVAAVENALGDAIAKAEDSIVAISREKGENGQETLAVRGRRPRPSPPQFRRNLVFNDLRAPLPDETDAISLDFGSGVVIGDKGQILTAYHVVKGARRLIVRACDRQQFDAEIIAADPRIDLAVIVPVEEGAEAPRLKPIPMGDASRMRKGTFLVALGNPFNSARDGKPSASWGILSNVARRVATETGEDANSPNSAPRGLLHYPTLLQLDSKLNSGLSGGAVINLKGELVGLTTLAESPAGFDSQAGYAIPMDKLGRRAVETLKDGREVEYGFLGIQAEPRASNKVGKVVINSPAFLADVQAGDEIIAVADQPVRDFDSLILAVNAYSAGDTVHLKVRRKDDMLDRPITLAKYPNDGDVIATNRPKLWRGIRVDYTSTQRQQTFDRRYLEMTPPGILVTEVEEGSRAKAAGMKRGQLILKVGDKAVANPPAFYKAIESLDGPVTLETDLGSVTVK
jgi:S1-C subfamily serine protease